MTGTHEPHEGDDPIEAYLDEVLVTLPGSPREVRHALNEVAAHLFDAAAAARADGLDEATARAVAVARMGPVTGLADRLPLRLRLTPALRRRLVLAMLFVGGIGGLAVGIGGGIGLIVQAVSGHSAIATPFPTGSYSAADCVRWLAGYPGSGNCVSAMTADHAVDFLRNAAAAGVLGVLTLCCYAALRRRWVSPAVVAALPRGSEDLAGAVLALGAAVLLLGQGLDAVLVTRGNGAGQPFSLAAAALVATTLFAVRAGRRLFCLPRTERVDQTG